MRISEAVQQIVAIYPGRFHPFHKGHASVYEYLKGKYDNVFIATSNKVDPPKSPFNFAEKREMMMHAGVPADAIVQTRNPYQAQEILEKYDPETTVVVFAVSEKDMAEDPRFAFKPKKDGSPSYFQPLKGQKTLAPYSKHGYITTVPTLDFSVLGKPMRSATELRQQFAAADTKVQAAIIRDLYGTYSPEIHKIMAEKIRESFERVTQIIEQLIELDRIRPLDESVKRRVGDIMEAWSEKYKRSIDCDNPKGFSQRAHCQGRKKNEDVEELANIPATLYHATYRPLLKSIKKYGLGGDKAQAKWEDSKPGVVYLALDKDVAESYAETSDVVPDEWLDEIVILKVSTAGLDLNNFNIDSNVQDNEGDTLEYHGIIPVTNIVAEGKSPHKKGTKKYKAHMAAMHAGMNESVNYVKPQFDVEWEEANRYDYLEKLGQAGWIELANKGKPVKVTKDSVKKIGNTGADGSETLDDLEPEKVERLKKAMKSSTIEMPIVVVQPDGSLDLVAGNTRLIGLISEYGEATVWLVNAMDLTEGKSKEGSYLLQLERDSDDLLVLHIKNTQTGQRTEVRGKPNYEGDGYDSDDKLHQLLDKIGKAANMSELMNGEVVSINPHHPDGKSAKAHAEKAFNEDIAQDIEAEFPGLYLDLYKTKAGYILGKIELPKEERGAGIGTQVMQRIVDMADSEGEVVALTPDTAFGASSKGRLEKFYKRFGFVFNKGRNKDFSFRETMIRYPKQTESISEAGVGRITPQNQTPDVGPNEIKKQAAKMGFKVDRDGRPPLLHKSAARNSDPNTLFNLGLVESQEELEERGSITVPFASGTVASVYPHRTLKVKKGTPGKMRYDDVVSEIETIDLRKTGHSGEIKRLWNSVKDHSQAVGKIADYDVYLYNYKYKYQIVFLVDPAKKTPVGSVELTKSGKSYYVDMLAFLPQAQGKGLAEKLYEFIVTKLKIMIRSGGSQSPGSQKLYAKLAQNPNVVVYGVRKGGRGFKYTQLEPDEISGRLRGTFDVYDAEAWEEYDTIVSELDSISVLLKKENSKKNPDNAEISRLNKLSNKLERELEKVKDEEVRAADSFIIIAPKGRAKVREAEDHSDGTYAAVYMKPQTAQRLVDWCKDNGIKTQPAENMHCTLIYSKTPVPELAQFDGTPVNITASVRGWKLLGTALVLELDCAACESLNKKMMAAGATSDYPSYIAHTTIDPEYDGDMPTVTPDFDLEYNRVTVTPINPDRTNPVAESQIMEKNVPTDPSKWSYYKRQAKKKFKVYPSAYANAWAAKKYKKAGGGWRKTKEDLEELKCWTGYERVPGKRAGEPGSCRKRGTKSESMGEAIKDAGIPEAIIDIDVNLKNRNKAFKEYQYGPSNPAPDLKDGQQDLGTFNVAEDLNAGMFKSQDEIMQGPNAKFWQGLMDTYNTEDLGGVLMQRCGNCAAFNVAKRITDAIADAIDPEYGDESATAGELGYCQFLKFKCAAMRTCEAWVGGGPITDETVEKTNEDLRDWFKQKWVNIGKKDASGKHPECGTSGSKKGYAKCVPASKAASMSKKEKESAVRRKRAAQNKAGRGGKDKPGSGKKPIRVSTKAKK